MSGQVWIDGILTFCYGITAVFFLYKTDGKPSEEGGGNMGAYEDITGKRFGRLVATKVHKKENRIEWWETICDCGTISIKRKPSLLVGETTSCGCLRKEIPNYKIHGRSKTTEFHIWVQMKMRCTNPNNHAFHHYGGRGITVCSEWSASFEAFYRDMGARPKKHSLDRIDNSKGYSKENCRWATQSIQTINSRMRCDNKTGVKGVSLSKTGKFIACLNKYGKNVHLGTFDELCDAKNAREQAENEYYKEIKFLRVSG